MANSVISRYVLFAVLVSFIFPPLFLPQRQTDNPSPHPPLLQIMGKNIFVYRGHAKTLKVAQNVVLLVVSTMTWWEINAKSSEHEAR
jgi:hypothetical protein